MARNRTQPMWQQPAWTLQMEKWTADQIRMNKWKFDTADDFDDLMQEGKLLWFTLSKMYPIATKDAHLAALYRTSFVRKLIDKARKRKYRITIDDTPIDDMLDSPVLAGNSNYGHISLLLQEMPEELKLVLKALTTSRTRLTLDKPTKTSRPRESTRHQNARLKRRFSLTTADPVGDLKAYFSNT